MKTRTTRILNLMKFVSWLAFIFLSISAGILLLTYCIGIFNPEMLTTFKSDFDIVALRQFSFLHFTITLLSLFTLAALKAYVSLLVIRILSGINLSNPFTFEMTQLLDKLSYTILGEWVVVFSYNAHASWLMKNVPETGIEHIPSEFIFLAGVVFIISQVFKRGIEIQTENELTV